MAIKAYELVWSGAAVDRLLSRNLLMCLQWLMSSDFLLRVALSGWQIMKYFSSRQRLHFFVRFEHDWAFPSVFHVIL